MHYVALAQLLILLTLANGSPVVAKWVFRSKWAAPLDGGVKFIDGRALFGSSKTIRGLLVSILTTSLSAPLIGLGLEIGFVVGLTAMVGDLYSSFVKRRFNLAPSSRATGLDQIPESLFPLLACQRALSLTALDILICAAIFFIGELILSPLLYKIRLRDRPY